MSAAHLKQLDWNVGLPYSWDSYDHEVSAKMAFIERYCNSKLSRTSEPKPLPLQSCIAHISHHKHSPSKELVLTSQLCSHSGCLCRGQFFHRCGDFLVKQCRAHRDVSSRSHSQRERDPHTHAHTLPVSITAHISGWTLIPKVHCNRCTSPSRAN